MVAAISITGFILDVVMQYLSISRSNLLETTKSEWLEHVETPLLINRLQRAIDPINQPTQIKKSA